MDSVDNSELFALFEKLSISAKTTEHEAVYTVEEQAKHAGSIHGTQTKNLFLKDKKHGLFLLTCVASKEVSMKEFASVLGLSGANMRFGDEKLLMEKLGVMRGAVSPLSLMHDTEVEVKFYLDQSLMETDIINIHPWRCDRTTSITPSDLVKFLEHINHKPNIVDLTNAAPGSTATPGGGSGGGEAKGPKPKPAQKAAKPPKQSKAPKAEAESEGGKNMKKETQLCLSVTKRRRFRDVVHTSDHSQ